MRAGTRRIEPLVKRTLAFDWSRAQPGAALLCLPAVALSLAVGVAVGRPRVGIMAAAGAFSVGLGSFQQIRGSRRLPMLVAAVGICLSSWIGTLAGLSPALTIALTGLWGAACGRRLGVQPGRLVAGAAVSHLAGDLDRLPRARNVGAGARILRAGRRSRADAGGLDRLAAGGPGSGPRLARGGSARQHTNRARAWRAAHAGLVLAVSMALARVVGLANSYWIPMTAAIVTRPAFRQTVERGVARTAGTLAGAALATLAAWAVHPNPARPVRAGRCCSPPPATCWSS